MLLPALLPALLAAAAAACLEGEDGCSACEGEACASCSEGYQLNAGDGLCHALCGGTLLDGCRVCGEGAACAACYPDFVPLSGGLCGARACYPEGGGAPCGGHGSCVNRACACAFNAKPSGASCAPGLTDGAIASIVISILFVVGLAVGMTFYGRMAREEAAMERKYEKHE